MMKNASTHKGHCQLCGRLQKLPKNVLSLHGYTVAHGYFSGVCRGAHGKPFEESTDLIEAEVVHAQSALAHLEAFQHKLRTDIDGETLMYVSTYVKDLHGYGKSGYVQEQVVLTAVLDAPEADGWQRIHYSFEDCNKLSGDHYNKGFKGVEPYEMKGATCEELRRATVLKYNALHADYLEREAKQLRAYISWQTERVRTWKPAPLVPNDVKRDKLGFDPDAVR
jgi:hypothetical protein